MTQFEFLYTVIPIGVMVFALAGSWVFFRWLDWIEARDAREAREATERKPAAE